MTGLSKVQMFQTSQPHNDDATNVNGQCTDRLDDVTNMNRQSTDNLTNESYKMTSWMHKMMSQQQQVVETTPGHSQKLLQPLRLLI